jgi:peptidoglycan/xylan/chitin deacetylase (PgdA/CDA1 family)
MPTVLLTFDVDGMSSWIGSFRSRSLSSVSRGELSPIGTRRMLALLDRLGLPATFFVPGHTADAFPGTLEAIVSAGHEVGHHGYVHEHPSALDESGERRALERGFEALDRIAGIRPTGYRAPGWEPSDRTAGLLLEYGFTYDSSLMGNDYEPYWLRSGDRWTDDGPYEFGKPIEIVELPVSFLLDDAAYYEFLASPAGIAPGLRASGEMLGIWQSELEYLEARQPEGVLVLTMHPEFSGRGGRLLALERWLIQLRDLSPHLEFASCDAVAQAWRSERQPSLPRDAKRREGDGDRAHG